MGECDIMNFYKQWEFDWCFSRPWKRYARDGEITCFKNKENSEEWQEDPDINIYMKGIQVNVKNSSIIESVR